MAPNVNLGLPEVTGLIGVNEPNHPSVNFENVSKRNMPMGSIHQGLVYVLESRVQAQDFVVLLNGFASNGQFGF